MIRRSCKWTTLAAFGLFAAIASSAFAADTITFGAALPLTGPMAIDGKKHQDGYELWKELINKDGGISINGTKHLVDIKYYDYKSDTATAVKLAEKLITEDNVRLLFGPMGSAAAKAVSSVTERYRVPMIAPSASSEEVFTAGYKYLFGTYTPNKTLTEPLAELMASLPEKPKTVAIVGRNDLFPLAIANEAKNSVTTRGMDVTLFEQYSIGTTDFSPLLIQLKNNNPDWIFITGYPVDLMQIARQMKELDVNAKAVTMLAGAVYKEFIEGLAADSNYITSACWWHSSLKYQGDDIFGTPQNFAGLFEERYNYIPDYTCATAAAVGVLFQAAIEKTGSTDPVKVRDALANLDLITFWGPIKFDQRGQLSTLVPPVLQIQNEEHVVVYPDNIAQEKVIYPRPNWKDR